MVVKKVFHQLHLWLGLPSGLLVFVIAITGCLYAFQSEIQDLTQPFRFVETENRSFAQPSLLENNARHALPEKQLHSIRYGARDRAAEAIFYHYNPTYYYTVYLNPYTGEVLKINDNEKGFFRFILKGHSYLWLPPKIGQPMVASATLVFLIIVITGLFLWWPKNRKVARQRFWFRWKKGERWPKINFDLHNIVGFYTLIFGLIFAVTGLVWGFQWFAQSYYKVAGGKKSLQYQAVVSKSDTSPVETDSVKAIDKVWLKLLDEYQDAASFELHPPETDSSAIAVNVGLQEGTYWKTDYRYFDQYSLKEIEVDNLYGKLQNAGFADKLMRMNYDIHTGSVLGLPGKIFAFLISLMIASLPVTGTIIWWKRRRR